MSSWPRLSICILWNQICCKHNGLTSQSGWMTCAFLPLFVSAGTSKFEFGSLDGEEPDIWLKLCLKRQWPQQQGNPQGACCLPRRQSWTPWRLLLWEVLPQDAGAVLRGTEQEVPWPLWGREKCRPHQGGGIWCDPRGRERNPQARIERGGGHQAESIMTKSSEVGNLEEFKEQPVLVGAAEQTKWEQSPQVSTHSIARKFVPLGHLTLDQMQFDVCSFWNLLWKWIHVLQNFHWQNRIWSL